MQWPHVAYLSLRLMFLCATGKAYVVNTPGVIPFTYIFLLTLIANILRDTIFLDGGQRWYQKYEVLHGQHIFPLTIAEDLMTVVSITNVMTVCAANRC